MDAPDAPTPAPLTAIQVAQGHSAISQPCLSNLVIYTEDMGDEGLISETIAEYVVKHPCRVILAVAQPRNGRTGLESSVSAHTYSDGTGKSVTCEQFTLTASGAAVKELASAVQPLLVADLPTYIWWRGIFLTQRLLVEQFFTFADRFIYDGVGWTNLHFTVLQVADLIPKYGDKVAFTNFNWSRLRPWRESIADFFDAGMYEREVWGLRQVRVDFMSLPGSEEGYQFRALLVVAWLAVQLEWEPVTGRPGLEQACIEFRDKKGDPVHAELVLLPQSGPMSQGLQGVVLFAGSGDLAHEFIVERDHGEHLMILRHKDTTSESVLRTVPHNDSSTADLLYRELGRRVRNRVFEKSFKMASRLLDMI
ncbi:MAG: glucose-6-phosphate dehydrogenase assembly protein OpcA [Candidatus Binatia bacterium]